MAKMTYLDMVQDILSDMSEDNVSSISDTATSERVAAIIKSTYFKMVEEKNWPHIGTMLQLTGLGDLAHPTHIQIPTDIRRVEWLKYDKRKAVTDPRAYGDVTLMKPLEFMELLNSRNDTATNIDVITDFSGNQLNIRNDSAPTAYTSFDDTYIVFDSYDANIESTVTSLNTQCFGYREPTWNVGATPDTFVPDAPAQMFPLFLSRAKTQCFNKIKQVVDSLEDRDSKRQGIIMQMPEHKNRSDGNPQRYSYGRK